MQRKFFTLALSGLLAVGIAGSTGFAQDSTAPQSQPAEAQPGSGGHGHRKAPDPDKQLAHMTKELNLTADQQTQIKPILVSRNEQMQQLFQDQSIARQDKRAKAEAIQSDSKSKIEAVLNDTQKQKFEQTHERMGQHRSQGQGAATQPQ